MMAHFFQLADMRYFRRPESMQFEGWVGLFKLAEKIRVKMQAQGGVMASLEKELVASPAKSLFNFSFVGVDIGDIGVGMAGDAIEIAELAIGDAYIRRIHVAVDL